MIYVIVDADEVPVGRAFTTLEAAEDYRAWNEGLRVVAVPLDQLEAKDGS